VASGAGERGRDREKEGEGEKERRRETEGEREWGREGEKEVERGREGGRERGMEGEGGRKIEGLRVWPPHHRPAKQSRLHQSRDACVHFVLPLISKGLTASISSLISSMCPKAAAVWSLVEPSAPWGDGW
jgi:hypothetical protein